MIPKLNFVCRFKVLFLKSLKCIESCNFVQMSFSLWSVEMDQASNWGHLEQKILSNWPPQLFQGHNLCCTGTAFRAAKLGSKIQEFENALADYFKSDSFTKIGFFATQGMSSPKNDCFANRPTFLKVGWFHAHGFLLRENIFRAAKNGIRNSRSAN